MDQQLFVKIGLASWNLQITRAEKVFSAYTDEQFYSEVAPGKNRIVYLYGHLAAYHDALAETLGLGKASKPEWFELFLKNPDNAETVYPSLAELKTFWHTVHNNLNELFVNLPAEEWFKRHNAMTDEDFEKDPSRNRLSVVINRANHIAYHIGQVNLVKPIVA